MQERGKGKLLFEQDETTNRNYRKKKQQRRSPNPVHEAKLYSLESIQMSEWISSDEEDEDNHEQHDTTDLRGCIFDEASYFQTKPLSALERLDHDTSASILRHLSIHEIAQLGTVSKAMYQATRFSHLWKIKFNERWNFDAASMNWFQAYQQAYRNTDDLWITHWNCVEPLDGLGPGRCCIQSSLSQKTDYEDNAHKLCPICRCHPTFSRTAYSCPETISTQAQAIALATRLRLMQQEHFPDDYPSAIPYSRRRAHRAFVKAATLHRRLSTEQYESESLHFLTDLLFFQVHDDPIEIQDMKLLFPSDDQHHSLVSSETALHSWHLCHFTNPDYKRPLVWRISIMRKDCFTVYPSEGYLAPGQSQMVVFGVRPLASLLAHATQQLNAHREGVDAFWANVYTEEAHLPPAPFLIHYHFATERRQQGTGIQGQVPQQDATPNDPNNTVGRMDLATNMQSTPWQRSGKPEQPVRIMYLSAHVNVEYSLDEFRIFTLVPFSVHDRRTIAHCAPQLMEFHPALAKILDRLTLEGDNDTVPAHAYRTEGPCSSCGDTWGSRLEELGQAFVTCRLECAIQRRRRTISFQKIHRVLTLLVKLILKQGWTQRHHQVCVEIFRRLVDSRAAPCLGPRQRRILCEWEATIDLLCMRFTPTDDLEQRGRTDYYMIPWKHAGSYRYALCTDSVFETEKSSGSSIFEHNTPLVPVLWKDEPKYLEAFAHLAHSPGRFCLGPQEDPNHLRTSPQLSRYARRQRGCVTDMFFDDPVCGLQAALCVVSDPRSLMVHGIWDRVPYPGTVIRRPKLLQLPLMQVQAIDRPSIRLCAFLSSRNKVLYYQLQNTLDMESLWLVDAWCSNNSIRVSSDAEILYPQSLRAFIQNIPAPGSGRFPLSISVEREDGSVQIQETMFHDEDNVVLSNDSGTLEYQDHITAQISARHHDFQNQFNLAVLHQPRPGPRILNLLWVLSAHLGWTVDDNQGAASVYVDRRILIGAQWLSISLMAAPLFWTLLARYARWIPATPVDYPLQALPFHVETELRFLSEHECGYVSVVLFFSWLCLGRWIERYTSRDFFRAMLENLPSDNETSRKAFLRRLYSYIALECQRKWDSICPLFLQRMVFVPKWNRRSRDDLMKHIAFWRSNQDQAASTTFRAVSGGGFVVFDSHDGQIHLGEVSWWTKVFLSLLVSLASFSASSPHFFLNLLTVFSSSISLVCRAKKNNIVARNDGNH